MQANTDQKLKINLTAQQIKAARIFLGWSQKELAKRLGLSVPWVKRIEGMTGIVDASINNLKILRMEFEENNIVFENTATEMSVKLLKK